MNPSPLSSIAEEQEFCCPIPAHARIPSSALLFSCATALRSLSLFSRCSGHGQEHPAHSTALLRATVSSNNGSWSRFNQREPENAPAGIFHQLSKPLSHLIVILLLLSACGRLDHGLWKPLSWWHLSPKSCGRLFWIPRPIPPQAHPFLSAPTCRAQHTRIPHCQKDLRPRRSIWPNVKCHLCLGVGMDFIIFKHLLQCQNAAELQKLNAIKKKIAEDGFFFCCSLGVLVGFFFLSGSWHLFNAWVRLTKLLVWNLSTVPRGFKEDA